MPASFQESMIRTCTALFTLTDVSNAIVEEGKIREEKRMAAHHLSSLARRTSVPGAGAATAPAIRLTAARMEANEVFIVVPSRPCKRVDSQEGGE